MFSNSERQLIESIFVTVSSGVVNTITESNWGGKRVVSAYNCSPWLGKLRAGTQAGVSVEGGVNAVSAAYWSTPPYLLAQFAFLYHSG